MKLAGNPRHSKTPFLKYILLFACKLEKQFVKIFVWTNFQMFQEIQESSWLHQQEVSQKSDLKAFLLVQQTPKNISDILWYLANFTSDFFLSFSAEFSVPIISNLFPDFFGPFRSVILLLIQESIKLELLKQIFPTTRPSILV